MIKIKYKTITKRKQIMIRGVHDDAWLRYGRFGWGFIQLILIILLITFLFWVFNSSENKTKPSEDQSIKILNERLARGEITEEEYDRLKRKINS